MAGILLLGLSERNSGDIWSWVSKLTRCGSYGICRRQGGREIDTAHHQGITGISALQPRLVAELWAAIPGRKANLKLVHRVSGQPADRQENVQVATDAVGSEKCASSVASQGTSCGRSVA